MDKALQAAIDKAKVISFDIFDTLIVRVYKKPTDLFRHLEQAEQVPGFAKARTEGEAKARKKALEASKREEVSLGEIYRAMDSKFASLREKEIELEKLACRQNPEMKAVFDDCIAKGKRVIIASDMYLPHEVIEEILKKSGYEGYEKLFLSSDTMHPKATGKMYQEILAYAGIPAGDILHIGDHPYTDGEMARKAGLENYLYLPIRETKGNIPNASYFATLNKYEEKSLVPSLLEGLITLHSAKCPEESYWESFGYKYAGIMATGYMKWLKQELDKRGIRKVFFMMRDGYIFKKVFDRLYPDFDTKEIYGSRTMFMLAGMESYEDIRIHVTGIHRQGLTYRRCYNRLSLNNKTLFEAYCEKFPDLDAKLQKEEDFSAVDEFFFKHESELKAVGKEDRETILQYFDSIGLFEEKCAIVDLGWKCSMLKSIYKICRMEYRNRDFVGFYLATHSYDEEEGIQAVCYAMERGESRGEYPFEALLNYEYIQVIMELMFSAPVPSIMRLQEKNKTIIPVYQEVCTEEKNRMNISEKILLGVQQFLSDVRVLDELFPVEIMARDAILPMEYFDKGVSWKDDFELSKVYTIPSTGTDTFSVPIFRHGACKFGVLQIWPGVTMSAEGEWLNRIEKAASECGMECIRLDNQGHLIDKDGQSTNKIIPAESLEFIISTHFDSFKLLDTYYYLTLWNPPEFLMWRPDYSTLLDHYLNVDDYLTYVDGTMSNHLKSLLMECPRDIDNASTLMASFPASAAMEPNLKNPKIFYCGMNWDVLKENGGKGRHEGVLKLLDRENVIKIFGPDVNKDWGGVRPWEGYKCYQHPIPFDGFSLLKELNDCGVCLVLSSDAHRRSSAVTNRAFEACAAGAVMICDDNPLLKEMFGDAALYIEYNRKDSNDTYRQIMERYQWICNNRKEAEQIAKRAQKLFIEKYSLNIYLNDMVHRHAKRREVIAENIFAHKKQSIVVVAYVCGTYDIVKAKKSLKIVLRNILHQAYRNIIPVCAIDQSLYEELEPYCKKICASCLLVPLPIYDKFGARIMTDGQVLTRIRCSVRHDYFVMTTAEETWFQDHVATLVRVLEDHSEAAISYAGQIFYDTNSYKHMHAYETMNDVALLTMNLTGPTWEMKYPFPGVFMFRSECHTLLPDFLFDCTDGREYLMYLHVLIFREGEKAVFSKRSTFQFIDHYIDERHQLIGMEHEERYIFGLTKFATRRVQADFLASAHNSSPSQKMIVERNPYGLEEDPYERFAFPWKAVAPGSRVIIYGGGIVGSAFVWQVANNAYCHVVAVVDKNPAGSKILAVPIITIDELSGYDENKYDCIVIALEKKSLAVEVRSDLEMSGIPAGKIKWLNPRRDGVVLQ